ncbi:hypothetical protein [Streptomyces sp. NPDC127084]
MERLTRQVLDGPGDDVVYTLVERADDGANDVVAKLLAQVRNRGDRE